MSQSNHANLRGGRHRRLIMSLLLCGIVVIALSNAAGQQPQTASNRLGVRPFNFQFTPQALLNLSGRIVDANNNALKNILVTLSGNQAASLRTDANGNFSFANVQSGGNYTITPTDSSLIFSPHSFVLNALSSSQSNINFTASINANPTPTPTPSDDFSGNVRDPNRWQLGTLTQPAGAFDPNVTANQQNGRLIITPIPGVSGLHYNGYVSSNSFDFTNGQVNLEVVQVGTGGAQTIFAIGSDSDNYFRFIAGTAANIFEAKQNGQTRNFTIPYDPVAQRFWRFRNDQTVTTDFPNGAIVFETSPENITYTERFRAAIQIPINSSQTEISAGTSTAVTNAGQAVFDNYQLTTNDIDSTSFFVAQHYRDFLNRPPDIGGLQFWTNEVLSCGADARCIDIKRQNVSAAYFLSIEFQQTGFLVYQLYKASFGNITNKPVAVTFQQFIPDVQAIGNGVIVGQAGYEQQLENNKVSFIAAFVNRSAFITQYPNTLTPAQFVDALNANTGNTLSQGDRNNLVSGLTNGTQTRATVLRQIADPDRNSAFKAAEFNRAFVLMQYFGYLRRNPDDSPDGNFSGYNFWLNKLTQFNGNYISSEMVRAFILSGEYRKRFGTP